MLGSQSSGTPAYVPPFHLVISAVLLSWLAEPAASTGLPQALPPPLPTLSPEGLTPGVTSAGAWQPPGSVSGISGCSDRSACRPPKACGATEALYRTGQLCRGFPYLAGKRRAWGWGDAWSEHRSTSRCTSPSCQTWEGAAGPTPDTPGSTSAGWCLLPSATPDGTACMEFSETLLSVEPCMPHEYTASGGAPLLQHGGGGRGGDGAFCCRQPTEEELIHCGSGCADHCRRRWVRRVSRGCECGGYTFAGYFAGGGGEGLVSLHHAGTLEEAAALQDELAEAEARSGAAAPVFSAPACAEWVCTEQHGGWGAEGVLPESQVAEVRFVPGPAPAGVLAAASARFLEGARLVVLLRENGTNCTTGEAETLLPAPIPVVAQGFLSASAGAAIGFGEGVPEVLPAAGVAGSPNATANRRTVQLHCAAVFEGATPPACKEWSFDADFSDFFAITECVCGKPLLASGEGGGAAGCAEWDCTTRSLDYYTPSVYWAAFGVVAVTAVPAYAAHCLFLAKKPWMRRAGVAGIVIFCTAIILPVCALMAGLPAVLLAVLWGCIACPALYFAYRANVSR